MKEYVHAKLHNIVVTGKSINYHGSVTICTALLSASGIEPYQKVDIVNLNTGGRWTTYAVPGPKGSFELNGGGARLGELGDKCVVITYQSSESFQGAKVIFCNENNDPIESLDYES
jgi:aspartate 1-decarboxylase